jgi:hypothetical protein
LLSRVLNFSKRVGSLARRLTFRGVAQPGLGQAALT